MRPNQLTEIKAIEHIQASHDDASIDYLLTLHETLIHHYAKKYVGQELNYDDLIQEGRMAILHAAKKFDRSKKAKFSTYASYWIKQAMSRYIDQHTKLLRIPQHQVDQLRKEKKNVHISIQSLDFEDDNQKTMQVQSSEQNPHQTYVHRVLEDEVKALLNTLQPMHQELLLRYFGFPPYHQHSLNDLNKHYHIPKKQIEKMIEHSLLMMHSKMKGVL